MPFVTAPTLIEQSDFTPGWAPDGSDAHRGPGELNDVMNLLLEEATGALTSRKGMLRKTTGGLGGVAGRYIVSMTPFKHGTSSYIICATTTGSAGTNNVRIFAVDTSTWAGTRIDTPTGVDWANPSAQHWGMSIDGTFYGGSRGNPMYSWDGSTYNDDAGTGNWKTAVATKADVPNLVTEWPKDFAYKGTEKAVYAGDYYTPSEGIRYDTWETGESYQKGDKVSRKVDHGTNEYWRSFKCIQDHSSDSTNRPGDGSGTPTDYWKNIRLGLPQDDDGETSQGWDVLLTAPQTSIAQWFAARLWLRADSQGEKARLVYSAPVKPEKGEDIPDTVFDPTDFTVGNDIRGQGGGWLEVSDGKHDGNITALHSFDQYLVIFKKNAVWALSGQSDQSFNLRVLERGVGCIAATAKTQHRGLLYFLDDDGLYVTDGTAVEAVAGLEKVRDYFRTRLDQAAKASALYAPSVYSWGDFVWVSIPEVTATEKFITIAYHPETGSFWKTDLPVLDIAKQVVDGIAHLYFCTPLTYGADIIYRHTGTVDDDGVDGGGSHDVNIAWLVKTAWWPFGLAKQDRRVRRTWALVKGAGTYVLKVYRNFSTSSSTDTTRALSGTTTQYMEGSWVPDAHAIEMKLSGTVAPVVVHGIAVDTQPRRSRYHTG